MIQFLSYPSTFDYITIDTFDADNPVGVRFRQVLV